MKIEEKNLGDIMGKQKNVASDMSILEIRDQYVLKTKAVKAEIDCLQRLNAEREIAIAKINKEFKVKEKAIGKKLEKTFKEICKRLEIFVLNLFSELKAKNTQMGSDEIKQIIKEWYEYEDALCGMDRAYCDTPYFKSLKKGNARFILETWAIRMAIGHLEAYLEGKTFRPPPCFC